MPFKLNLLVLVAAILAWASPGVAPAQQLPLHYLTQQDGLGNLAVNVLAQDQAGYLWVGTDNGLFRYNGANFQRFAKSEGLSETLITALLADPQRRLWVGTYEGLYLRVGERMVTVSQAGRRLPVPPGQALAAGRAGSVMLVSAQALLQLFEADGKVVVHPYFSSDQIRRQPALEKIHSIRTERDGELWMGCGDSLCSEGARGVTVWDSAAGVPADRWFSTTRASDGVLWARGAHHIVALEPGAVRFTDRTPPGDVMRKNNSQGGAIVEDADHRMLTSTDQGVARWRAGRWELFDGRNGLKVGGGLPAMLIDRDQGLWLATRGHGLVHWLGYDNWQNWTTAQGLPDDMVLSFMRDGAGGMHIGTRSGPALLDGADATLAVPVRGYAGHQWTSQALDRHGQAWGGSYSGLLTRYDPRDGAEVTVAKLPPISALLSDRDGALWINTPEGLYVLEHPGSGVPPRRPDGLAAGSGLLREWMRGSCQSKDGTLWFLSETALWRHRAGRWNSYALKEPGKARFSALACAADGALWLGRGPSGVWHARVDEHGLVKTELASPLLRDKRVLTILEDRRGWLWLGTDAGIMAWNGRQWRQFDSDDGLVGNDLNNRALFEDVDGSIWLPTSNGASRILHPERLFAPENLSPIVESVMRDGEPLGLREGGTLAWSRGALHFMMASLSYQHRAALRFRYRLAGLEQEWSSTAMSELRYAALPPGQYRLQYAVENLDTQTVSATREFGFVISPPWWQTTAFYLLCASAALTVLWGLHRYRVRGLKARAVQMESLVRVRTHELEQRTRELELSQEALRERALRDGLTKAWNRMAMLEMLDQALQKSRRDGAAFLLVLLDLDHFKRINDTHGHLAGDAVLREVVARLNASVRPYDLVGRYGGEEFLVLLPGLGQAGGAARVEAMRAAIAAAPIDIGAGRALAVSASFGVVEFDPARPAAALELVRRADLALYRAKERGRDRIEYAGAADAQAQTQGRA